LHIRYVGSAGLPFDGSGHFEPLPVNQHLYKSGLNNSMLLGASFCFLFFIVLDFV